MAPDPRGLSRIPVSSVRTMRRLIPLSFLVASVLYLAACDSADPGASPPPEELLTAHRWYSHGHTSIDVETGEPYDDDEFLLPDWYEFGADGTMRASQFGHVSQTTYELSADGSSFTAIGITWHILDLTESMLRFRYEAFGSEFTVTTHPKQP